MAKKGKTNAAQFKKSTSMGQRKGGVMRNNNKRKATTPAADITNMHKKGMAGY